MDFKEYQLKALESDQVPTEKYREDLIEKIVPLLGLAGEAGGLLSEYKKHLRDGPAHKLFKERISEELGDLLWYISNVASKFDLDLETIAKDNIEKVQERFVHKTAGATCYIFDRDFPENETLPRQFMIEIKELKENASYRVQAFYEGKQVGNDLTDNAHDPDGYRFHDVFHLGYAAVLGWSPVTRKILGRKRKSRPQIDEVEDGGRANAIEEGVSALVFSYAEAHGFFENVSELDYSLLKTIGYLTNRLEVNICSTGDWERAVLTGYKVWRRIRDHHGGRVIADLDQQTLEFEKLY
ncbi:MAG TPA: nucleoside triphosphate pyrophosphohydrolase family protein [Pyrinomonadaceae bacterium]|nr:nucleoside triphosphate pyrophosphohydrolase family protein [Pyrinomonadaceae bacterium]HMP64804.1 nucleoside triphosphate pyrophosphohydrolase family protein [Pyrinomonadaceae bacterium]